MRAPGFSGRLFHPTPCTSRRQRRQEGPSCVEGRWVSVHRLCVLLSCPLPPPCSPPRPLQTPTPSPTLSASFLSFFLPLTVEPKGCEGPGPSGVRERDVGWDRPRRASGGPAGLSLPFSGVPMRETAAAGGWVWSLFRSGISLLRTHRPPPTFPAPLLPFIPPQGGPEELEESVNVSPLGSSWP